MRPSGGKGRRCPKMAKKVKPMDALVGGGSWVVRCDKCGEFVARYRNEPAALKANQFCPKHTKP